MSYAIRRKGVTYRAAKCERCGLLMWPAKQLRVHRLIHKVRDTRHVLTQEQTRRLFTSMRNAW
jgi:hypothetical protein